MLFRSGKIVDDHFGLPLAGAVAREIEARHEKAELVRLEAEALAQRQANDRVASLENEAREVLKHDARAWLDVVNQNLGDTPRAAAACSESDFAQARSMLRHHANERERSRNLEQLRSRLLSAATQMRRPEQTGSASCGAKVCQYV